MHWLASDLAISLAWTLKLRMPPTDLSAVALGGQHSLAIIYYTRIVTLHNKSPISPKCRATKRDVDERQDRSQASASLAMNNCSDACRAILVIQLRSKGGRKSCLARWLARIYYFEHALGKLASSLQVCGLERRPLVAIRVEICQPSIEMQICFPAGSA